MITKEELDAIDVLLVADGAAPVEGTTPPWYGGGAMDVEVSQELRELGVVGIALLPRLNSRRKYESTPWVLVKDPTDEKRLRFIPELHLRATAKFGKLEVFHAPAKLANGSIEVFTRTGSSGSKENKYGVPAGTTEYSKRWREANKERVKAANRKNNERRKLAMQLLKGKTATIVLPNEQKQSELDALAEKVGVDPNAVK